MTFTDDDRLGRLPDPANADEAAYYRGVNAKRLIAFFIDSLIILALTAVLIPFTAFTAIFFIGFFALIVSFLYRTLTLSGNSATWGMRLTGMELRRADGTRFDFGTAALHTALYTFAVAVAPLQLISIILMLITDRKQGLGDMILGTAPIRRKV